MRVAGLCWVAGALLGCGGAVDGGSLSQLGTGDSISDSADSGAAASGGASAGDAGGGDGGAAAAASGDSGAFQGKECPYQPSLEGFRECEPFAAQTGCMEGFRCIPYVTYPQTCEPEEFGTICAPSGPGTQGESCDQQDCAAGHLCVTTGQGTQCAKLCRMEQPDDCSPGLLCASVDVDGFYACF